MTFGDELAFGRRVCAHVTVGLADRSCLVFFITLECFVTKQVGEAKIL